MLHVGNAMIDLFWTSVVNQCDVHAVVIHIIVKVFVKTAGAQWKEEEEIAIISERTNFLIVVILVNTKICQFADFAIFYRLCQFISL